MRAIRERLNDIAEAIAKIEAERPREKTEFLANRLLQVWMVHHLMIIGEAARAIDPAFRQQHPSVPWRQISSMRNILVHDYFRINEEIVWATVERDIPPLKLSVTEILANLPP
jgi:uncharacterized protein with HEPN domain